MISDETYTRSPVARSEVGSAGFTMERRRSHPPSFPSPATSLHPACLDVSASFVDFAAEGMQQRSFAVSTFSKTYASRWQAA